MLYIGIDLGTSFIKGAVLDLEWKVRDLLYNEIPGKPLENTTNTFGIGIKPFKPDLLLIITRLRVIYHPDQLCLSNWPSISL